MKTRTVLNREYQKSFVLFMTLCLLLILLQSCNKDSDVAPLLPEASFELSIAEAEPLTISLTNTSSNATSYLWDFGDGETSSTLEDTLTYTYGEAGSYVVRLIAYGSELENEFSKSIELIFKERYKDDIFSEVISNEGSYGSFPENKFEFVEPKGDNDSLRPLILLSPGGNFASLTRESELRSMLSGLAKKGFVGALVGYSQIQGNIGTSLSDFSDLLIKGVRDQRAAIRYFRSNAEKYGINPDQIYIGGWSTGATLAVSTVYLRDDNVSTITDANVATALSVSMDKYGGLDNGDSPGVSSKPNGAFIVMGYTLDLALLDTNIPLLMINHEKAVTVSDCQSLTGAIDINFSDVSITAYGTNSIYEVVKNGELKDGEDLKYILQNNWEAGWKECDWYPNVSTLTSDNYEAIADFFYRNL